MNAGRVLARLGPAFLLLPILWLFFGPLFLGRVLYFRDISVTYYPDYVFVSRWLTKGLWPLWNSDCDAGAPFLMAYPPDLFLLWLMGPRAALALSPALHVFIGMWGMATLARRLGCGGWAAWVGGCAFGCSGLILSSLLYPNFLAAAWTPWILVCIRDLSEDPALRRVVPLGLLLALQVSAFGAEVVLQTAFLAPFFLARRPRLRELRALALAGGLSLCLAAPAVLGAISLLTGSSRGRGFAPDVALSYSAPLPVLAEAFFPHFFGDVHTFSDLGYWGQAFFPEGSPYYLSLYLGPGLLILALCAGPSRLWIPFVLGILLSLGSYGPLQPILVFLLTFLRVPVKFFFLSTVALCLLAAQGLHRALLLGRRRVWVVLPGLVLSGLGALVLLRPGAPAALLGRLLPEITGAGAAVVVRSMWPHEMLATGALTVAGGLALWGGRRTAGWAGALALLDLLRVNGALNPSTEASFYALRPEIQAAVREAAAEGPYRWFSFGVANSPGLHWNPRVGQPNSDVWLYYLDRQSLLPRTQVLDNLEGAFDLDRMGWAPPGATLSVPELDPLRYRSIHERLRLASVRWVIAFQALPEDLLRLRREVVLPEMQEPLRLYEIREALPRAFWAPPGRFAERDGGLTLLPGYPGPDASEVAPVEYERPDPHTVRLRASTPPGYILVAEGYHPDWQAEGAEGSVPILRANGRYWAIRTPGGTRTYEVRYRPRWRDPALGLSLAGLGLALLLSWRARPGPGDLTGRG